MERAGGAMEVPGVPRLAWKWILEELVDAPEFGVAFINEVVSNHVKDIEQPRHRSLLGRVALRNLEEMVVTNQIDSDAIPLLKELTREDSGAAMIGSSVKQRFNRELVLRVQTEVVLSVLRGDVEEDEDRVWARYKSKLEGVFGEAEEDNRLLDRRMELGALLKPKNQKPANVAAYFEKYSLKKLMSDLSSFIEEKKKSFKTMFLDQLSRDFFDSNGTPFSLEPSKVDANGNQDHVGNVNVENLPGMTCAQSKEDMDLEEVGQNPNLVETDGLHGMNGTGDRNIFSRTVSGKKRVRRKLRPTQDDIGDDESVEAQEGNEGTKKARKVSPTSVINPSKGMLHQSVSVKVTSKLGPRNGCSRVKHEVESVEQLPSSRKGEEGMSAPRNIGSNAIRRCSPPVHASMNMRAAKADPKEPSRTKKYVIISDVESDAETQVVKRLSTSDEDDPIENCEDVRHRKKADQSLLENASDRGRSERVVPTEVVRKETIIVRSERAAMVDGRKEALTASPQVKISQQGGSEKIVIKNGSTSQDTRDIYNLNLREVGEDGQEDLCHVCEGEGTLDCCEGCPIAMHKMCIEALDLGLPPEGEKWYCPVCVSKEAARQAAEAERVAAAAKEKFISFQEVSKRRSSSEGSLLHHEKQVKTVKQSRLGVNSLQPEGLDRASKPQQRSPEEPKISKSQRRSAEEPKASKAQERSPEEPKASKSQQRSPEDPKPIEGRQDPDPPLPPFLQKAMQELKKRDEDPGNAEPGSNAAGREEVGDDRDYEDPDDDRVEYINQIPFFSGRRKITGLRRKRLPWTREEEHALKEGVKRFSNNGIWGFQWKRILEFGRGRFDPSRTDVDLKDKWRNLVKGVS